MQTDPDSYDLAQIATAAGVTARTIRYYIQQGILPAPTNRGPGARYSDRHLDRLRLIRRWQRAHLPLAEIRRRLEDLDDAGVRTALAEPASDSTRGPSDVGGGREGGGGEGTSAALAYVRELLSPTRPPAISARTPHVLAAAPTLDLWSTESAAADAADVTTMANSPVPAAGSQVPHALAPHSDDPNAGQSLRVSEERSDGSTFDAPSPPRRPEPAPTDRISRETRSTWERLRLSPDVELHVRRPLTRHQNRFVERLLKFARHLLEEEN